jgi:formylglycine-generating enzyme required for sulfatase activity
MTNPSVFLSYSHDSAAHKAWVRKLAEDLRHGGVDATLDQWDLKAGADLVAFMEAGIRRAERVLLVCTSNYVRKAEQRKGGAGYEGMIVTSHVARSTDTVKFIPLVRDNASDPLLPDFLGPRFWLDFRDDHLYDERLEDLLRELHDQPRFRKPPLGRPAFLKGPAEPRRQPPAGNPGPAADQPAASPRAGGPEPQANEPRKANPQEAKAPEVEPQDAPPPQAGPPAQASPPPQAQQPPPDRVPPKASIPGLPSQPLALETARILRQGNGWQLEKRPLQVERALLPLGDGEGLPLLWIPAGEFVMGSPGDEPERADREGPQHRVRLEGFWLGQTPVTQAQWRVVAKLVPPLGKSWLRELKAAPSYFQPEADKSASMGRFALLPGEASSDQRPVERVSWHDAIEFCRRLDTLLPTHSGLRCSLPSEAQWEYACRAESSTAFAFGETLTPELANYHGKWPYANGPNGEGRQQTTPVGMFAANAWGLQDMHGNVWEWCLDHLHDSYRDAPFAGGAWLDSEPVNMQTNDDRSRLLRGGSWSGRPRNCRSACRGSTRPYQADDDFGFRVVCLPQDASLNS